jgi:formate dehydrogenase iron-sulfur subunit
MIGILVDVTRCVGCYECVEACTQVHQLGEDPPLLQRSADGLSARRWATIITQPGGRNIRKSCFHCLDPACVSACPVGAMVKLPEGPVVYDPRRCMGCRYCMMACPFGIPRYEWDQAVPYVRKCTLCYERLQEGQQPACVEACPQKAMVFGERDDLLAGAHQRLEAEPGRYIQKVYGENEVGGTSILYISDISLDFLGYQGDPGQEPLPDLSWAWLDKTPVVSLGVMASMAGIYWVIQRRRQMAAARAPVNAAVAETHLTKEQTEEAKTDEQAHTG